jgi:hypothetical protein
MSFESNKLVPIVKHTYSQCKEVHVGYEHWGKYFLVGYRVLRCKGYKQGSTWLMMKIVEIIGL